MPREKDPFRGYVLFLQNDRSKWKCNFCKTEYRGSVTRIKAHLAGFRGYGITGCKKVSPRVRSDARKALKRKGAAESSNGSEGNVEEGMHQLVTANNDDAPRETSVPTMPYQSIDGASSSALLGFPATNLPNQFLHTQVTMDNSFRTQPPQHQAGDSCIQPRNMSDPSSGGRLTLEALPNMLGPVNAEEGEPNDAEISQDCVLMDRRPSTSKRKLEELSNREASLPLVTTELVGEESKEAIKKICDYLMENEIDIIGIYGMGGVGKTAILMHVHNRVLENPTFSSSVFWVSVPQKFSVYELQDEIANAIGLDTLSKDKDVKRRASILHRHLENMKRPILLLDGLWMHFEVKDVGIPIKKDGLKLVLTTRSLDVCHKMLCKKQIKIRPLRQYPQNDSWSLFQEKLCSVKKLPSEVEEIARSILDKCGGLPLGIIEIATRMRGVEKVHEWKGILRKLEDSRAELDVFKRLKLSYFNLGDSQMQRCFLHLVLCFEEYFSEPEEDEIESFIDEGLLSEIATRQELHDQGKTILDNLRKACLREDPGVRPHVHPLIRDMALQMVTSTTHMVKARMGLEEIPKEEFWTDSLEKVFLQDNYIKEIPHGISPNCPKLTRLSLNGNVFLEAIRESFFRHLNGLKVLDLSNTSLKELPDSISHLESLEALLLRSCGELRRIPCVGKLGSLRKLDLNGCAWIEEVPEGMEMLVKLTYLDLLETDIKTFPEGVLGKLVNLQYLAIGDWSAQPGEINCSVSDVDTFNSFVRFIERNSTQDYTLRLTVSREEDFFTDDDDEEFYWGDYKRYIEIGSCHSVAAWVDGGIGGDGRGLLLPKNVEVLRVGGCGGVTSLCEVGPLENLEQLEIKGWENLERVGSVNFPRLNRLKITGCSKLKHLWEEGQRFPRLTPNTSRLNLEEIRRGPLPSGITCGRLIYLQVDGCNNMKGVLLTQDILLHLPFLKKISIKDCEGIEEIIRGGPVPVGATHGVKYLEINGCNNMKRVLLTQDMLLHLPFLEKISVSNCEGMEEIIGGGLVPTGAPCGLKYLEVNGCNNMKRVLQTQDLLLYLPFLERIDAKDCEGMEEIIGGGPVPIGVTCRLSYLVIKRCNNMKRVLPPLANDDEHGLLPSPLPSLHRISIDRQTLESLEWDHPLARSSLPRFVNFYVSDW